MKEVYVLINDLGYQEGALLGVYETLEQAKDEEKKYCQGEKYYQENDPSNITICRIVLNAPVGSEKKEGRYYL